MGTQSQRDAPRSLAGYFSGSLRGCCMNIPDCTIVPVEVRNNPAFLPECILSNTNCTNGLLFSSYATASFPMFFHSAIRSFFRIPNAFPPVSRICSCHPISVIARFWTGIIPPAFEKMDHALVNGSITVIHGTFLKCESSV